MLVNLFNRSFRLFPGIFLAKVFTHCQEKNMTLSGVFCLRFFRIERGHGPKTIFYDYRYFLATSGINGLIFRIIYPLNMLEKS
jgi:hypothetical protein